MPLRIVFMGTPEFATPTLAALVGQGHAIAAVYTRQPAKAGRGMALKPSPVQAFAETIGAPVVTPRTLRDAGEQARFASFEADVAVVVAYGLLLPKPVLDAPRLGCLNLHASLLPRWRGAAPIHRSVMAGDSETGVMVMAMEEGLDTGPVAMAERTPIGPDETTGDLHDRLKTLGADLMARAVAVLARGSLGFTPQAETGVTYATKLSNEDSRIDWARPARELHDLVRGLSPFPGAFFETDLGRGPERVRALRARAVAGAGDAVAGTVLDDAPTVGCGAGALTLLEVQRAGGRPMPGADFARGARLGPGTRL
jgi:methionyl-tRNA formyltransferase